MIGIILLIIAILAFQHRKLSLALLIILGFVSDGFRVFPDSVVGIKNGDLALCAFVGCFVFSQNMKTKYTSIKSTYSYKLIVYFLVFLVASAAFSYFHYRFSIMQIIQGGRHFFAILLFYLLIKIDVKYIRYVLVRPVFYITIVVAILYIVQVLTGVPILPAPAASEVGIDADTGIARFYNSPVYLKFYLYALCLAPNMFNTRYKNLIIVIFFLSLLCTQGRTNIGTTIAILFLGLLLQNKYGRLMKYALIGCIMILPFLDVITNRIEGADTGGDLESVFDGHFIDLVNQRGRPTGTMEYRFAWTYERILYLIDRPVGEKIFGLGMISESQSIVDKKYNFFFGLNNENTGRACQLSTPDVSLGEMISRFGFGGTVLLYALWFSFLFYFYKNRKVSSFSFVGFLFTLATIVGSISNSSLAKTSNLIFYIMIFLLVNSEVTKQSKQQTNQ